MGNMKDIGLLDCEDRPSVEENFKRVQAGGGGGAILDSNGKLKSEVLPEGYPYEKTTTSEPQTYNYAPVEKSSGNPCHADGYFPADSPIFKLGGDGFQEGQLVRVNYDGVNYDCVVRYAHFNWWIGNPTLTKNSSENGSMDNGIDYIEESEHYVDSGEPFCYIVHNYYNTRYALFTLDTKPRTVTFTPIEKEIIPMAEKFLPKITIVQDGYDDAAMGVMATAAAVNTCTANVTFAELMQMMAAKTVPPIEIYYTGLDTELMGHAEGGTINFFTNDMGIYATIEFVYSIGRVCVDWSAEELTVIRI